MSAALPALRTLDDVKREYAATYEKLKSAVSSDDKAILAAQLDKLALEAQQGYNVPIADLQASVAATPATTASTTLDMRDPAYLMMIAKQNAEANRAAELQGDKFAKATLGAGVASEGLNFLTGIGQLIQGHHALKNLRSEEHTSELQSH